MTASISKLIADQIDLKKDPVDEAMDGILKAIRNHLDMKVAFISEFKEGRRFFRYIDSGDSNPPIKVNNSDLLEETYCQRIVDGRLPEIIHDASKVPEARKLSVTTALPVGAHMSVPIFLGNGELYGTFCAFSYSPDETLRDRDLGLMRALAEIAGNRIDQEIRQRKSEETIKNRINAVISGE